MYIRSTRLEKLHLEKGSGAAAGNRVGEKWNPHLSNYGINTVVTGGANAATIQKWNNYTDKTNENEEVVKTDMNISKGLKMLREIST